MKKFICLVLIGVLLICLCGCKNQEDDYTYEKNLTKNQDFNVVEDGNEKNETEKTSDSLTNIYNTAFKDCKVGDIVCFGYYEQDNDTTNGEEEIEWRILDIQYDKALIISEYSLDCQMYNSAYIDVTWETCSLRQWLNNDFYNSAFSEEEKSFIPTVNVYAHENPEHYTKPGNVTEDKIFLLSITEVTEYMDLPEDRECKPTAFSESQGTWTNDGCCCWWLRSPGRCQSNAALIYDDGDVSYGGSYVISPNGGIRPALWVAIE